jgi:hypothetical protein
VGIGALHVHKGSEEPRPAWFLNRSTRRTYAAGTSTDLCRVVSMIFKYSRRFLQGGREACPQAATTEFRQGRDQRRERSVSRSSPRRARAAHMNGLGRLSAPPTAERMPSVIPAASQRGTASEAADIS